MNWQGKWWTNTTPPPGERGGFGNLPTTPQRETRENTPQRSYRFGEADVQSHKLSGLVRTPKVWTVKDAKLARFRCQCGEVKTGDLKGVVYFKPEFQINPDITAIHPQAQGVNKYELGPESGR